MTHVNEDFSTRSKLQDLGRWYVNGFVEATAAQLPSGSLVLDAGAGECVYKHLFAHCQYKAIDLAVGDHAWNYGNLDYVAPLHDMPVGDCSFDAVLCTQVLEHLEWPRESVQEMFRVLKPGGRLFLTAPMAQGEHQIPYDFFRYTSYGLRAICRHAGFNDIEVVPFGGLFSRWAYELPASMVMFARVRKDDGSLSPIGLVVWPIKIAWIVALRGLQWVLVKLDKLDRVKNSPFGWGLVARK